jgi:hypothetical protein
MWNLDILINNKQECLLFNLARFDKGITTREISDLLCLSLVESVCKIINMTELKLESPLKHFIVSYNSCVVKM